MKRNRISVLLVVGLFAASGSTAFAKSGGSSTNPPSNLVVAIVSGQCKQLRLTWNDNSTVETNFRVERSLTGGGAGFLEIATVGPGTGSTFTYLDTSVNDDTTYYYRVRYFISPSTFSTYSNEANGNTGFVCTPSGLTVSASLASCTRLNLSWTDNSKVDTQYRIERKTGTCTGSFTLLDTIPGDGPTTGVRTYQDNTLLGGTQYSYRVQATNSVSGTASAYSNCASGTTTACNATK